MKFCSSSSPSKNSPNSPTHGVGTSQTVFKMNNVSEMCKSIMLPLKKAGFHNAAAYQTQILLTNCDCNYNDSIGTKAVRHWESAILNC